MTIAGFPALPCASRVSGLLADMGQVTSEFSLHQRADLLLKPVDMPGGLTP